MATGDLEGNLERLRGQLQSIQYPYTFDVQGLKEGLPACILPIVHYSLLGYSRHLARFLSANGYELWAKSDLRFMEATLKFLRQEFNYRSALTTTQLFARGYAERKLLFLCDVIQMSKRKHNELLKLFHEKTHVHKVNYDPAKFATARRACQGASATSVPFVETKAWERTLRMPEEKVHVDATVVPAARADLAAQSTETELKFHPKKSSLETVVDNAVNLVALTAAEQILSSMSSPETVKPDADDLSQITHDHLPQIRRPSSSESLSALRDEQHHNLVQARPPPRSAPMSASQDDEHHDLLQVQPPPSFKPINAVHDDDHHFSLQAQPPSPRPLGASHDDDHLFSVQAQPSPSRGRLSASHDNAHQGQDMVQDYHEELWQKIMEMADRLEVRFCSLDDEITKARETLEEKLVSLEGRVSLLEAVMPHQENGFENLDGRVQQSFLPQQVLQPPASTGWQENGFDLARWQPHLDRNREHLPPRAPFHENLQSCECQQILWIPHQKGPAAFFDVNPYFNLLQCGPCGAGMPVPVVDQYLANNNGRQ